MRVRVVQSLSVLAIVVAAVWLYIQPGPEPLITAIAGLIGLVSARSDTRRDFSRSVTTPPIMPRDISNPSVAVLPFQNLSEQSETEYFADGIAEDIMASLARVRSLRVISRNSAMRFKSTPADVRTIAKELNVSSVLEGSIRKDGNRIRIIVRLTDPVTLEHLWADRYDRELVDIMAIQADVARSVAEALGAHLGGRRSEAHHTGDPEAYRLHMLGRFHSSKWSQTGWQLALRHLEDAIARDPTYAAPHATLAYNYAIRAYMHVLSPAEAFSRAEQEARLALALNSEEPEAHVALGLVSYWMHWDWPSALASLRRAVEISPGTSTAQTFLGSVLDTVGKHEEAMERRRTAYDLDPLNPTTAFNLGYGHMVGRRFPEAIQQFERALELEPRNAAATYGLGICQVDGGDPSAGCQTFERGTDEVDSSSTMFGFLGWAYAVAGRDNDARRILVKLTQSTPPEQLSAYHVSLVHLGLGDHDQFFRWLERAYEERSTWMVWFHITASLDPVRNDPRFHDMVKRMNLPDKALL